MKKDNFSSPLLNLSLCLGTDVHLLFTYSHEFEPTPLPTTNKWAQRTINLPFICISRCLFMPGDVLKWTLNPGPVFRSRRTCRYLPIDQVLHVAASRIRPYRSPLLAVVLFKIFPHHRPQRWVQGSSSKRIICT